MIPKIIHYCWFGRGEKPELAKRCIASWRKFCPEFEIREWNEDNCDYLAVPFMAEAYAAKKYAFVTDVMRLLVLEQYGGVYFDTDVEVVRDISPLLNDEGFIGFENDQFEQRTGHGGCAAPECCAGDDRGIQAAAFHQRRGEPEHRDLPAPEYRRAGALRPCPKRTGTAY